MAWQRERHKSERGPAKAVNSKIGRVVGKSRKEQPLGAALSWGKPLSREVAMMQSSPVNQKRGFQIHAFVFVAAMIFLAALNYSLGEPFWVVWPLIGWGIGLLAHWWFVLGPGADATK